MSKLKEARSTRSLLRRLPEASQTEIIGAFERGGPRLRAAMQAKAKRKTGTLAAGVKFRIYPKTLRMQVGLLGTKRGRAKLFYGFVLDKGRKAQVVTVQRRRIGVGKVLSRGRKRAQDIVSTYRLRVKALAADRFVTGRYPDLRRVMGDEVRTLFDRALRRVAGGTRD